VSITNQRIAVNHSKKLVDSELGRQYESTIEIIVVEDGSISADSSSPVCKFSFQDLLSSMITNIDESILRGGTLLRNCTPWENNIVVV
jgi:hypothetical protein